MVYFSFKKYYAYAVFGIKLKKFVRLLYIQLKTNMKQQTKR